MSRRHTVAAQETELVVRSRRDGCAHVVALVGELDAHTAHLFENELKRVEATDARQIVVDLSGLSSITAGGLKPFIHASARSRDNGCRLMLIRAPARVRATFETTGLLSRLPFTIMS